MFHAQFAALKPLKPQVETQSTAIAFGTCLRLSVAVQYFKGKCGKRARTICVQICSQHLSENVHSIVYARCHNIRLICFKEWQIVGWVAGCTFATLNSVGSMSRCYYLFCL